MFIELIEAFTNKPVTFNTNRIINFCPCDGKCAILTTDGETTFVEETYNDVKAIISSYELM